MRLMRQVIHYESENRIFVSNSDDWRYQSREWRYCWNSASWEIHLITVENSIRAENNRGDDDSDINNEKDFCFSFIKSIESSHNLSFKIEKSTSISREKIDQVLSHDEFLNVDEFLSLVELWTISLASDQSQLQEDVAQSSMKQSSSWRMSNLMLSTDDESMTATITLKSWNFFKRKSVTIDLNEDSRVKIHDKTVFTSVSTCLIILQNVHSNFSMTSKAMTDSISRSSNQSWNLAISETRTRTTCWAECSSSHWASRYWLFRNWVSTISSVRHRLSVQISANVSIVVGTSDNSRRLDRNQWYRWEQNRHRWSWSFFIEET